MTAVEVLLADDDPGLRTLVAERIGEDVGDAAAHRGRAAEHGLALFDKLDLEETIEGSARQPLRPGRRCRPGADG